MSHLKYLLALLLLLVAVPANSYQTKKYELYMPVVYRDYSGTLSGITWHNRLPDDKNTLGGINWYYTYGLKSYVNETTPFVPMIWCDKWPSYDYLDNYNYLEHGVDLIPHDYSGYILFLNEPDLPGAQDGSGQCGITPLQAAYLYSDVLKLWPEAKIVAPAVSHIDYLQGWTWLKAWQYELQKAGLPLPHISAIHTYLDEDPNLILDSYLDNVANDRPIWVTEFGSCRPSRSQEMIDTWRDRPEVIRYAWFTTRRGGCTDLFDADGNLTPNGLVWQSNHK